MTSAQSELFHTVLVYVICLRRESSNRFAFNRKRSEWDWTIGRTYKDVEFLYLVLGRYAVLGDLRKLNWLPIIKRRDMALLKITHKALYDDV